MAKPTINEIEVLLKRLQLFFVGTIFKGDPKAQFEVNELFDQLHNLLLDYKQRQGG